MAKRIEPTEVYLAKSKDEFFEHYNVSEILKERYNYICETVIDDIGPLSKHIETWFHLENARPVLPEIP